MSAQIKVGKVGVVSMSSQGKSLLLSKVSPRVASSSCCTHSIDLFTRIIALQSKYSFFSSSDTLVNA